MVESQVSLLLYCLFPLALKNTNIQHVTHFTLSADMKIILKIREDLRRFKKNFRRFNK